MQFRVLAALIVLLALTIPASALPTAKFSDPAVVASASRLKQKDYRGAREAALKAGDAGVRAFLIGITDLRLERYEEAATQLAYAAETFPLLGDYALYNQGLALSKIPRPEEALVPLQRLVKSWPASRLVRPALLLAADTLFAAGHYREALEAYSSFVERYPLGPDSLNALYGCALSREKMGDGPGALTAFRTIWINNPGSALAPKAAEEMARLVENGVKLPPYTTDELFKRANALYDVGQFAKAAQGYADLIPRVNGEFAARLTLKLGQAQFKARRYQEALDALRPVADNATAAEAGYWYARALEKTGKSEQAYGRYLALSDRAVGGSLADDALLDAAYLRRYQGRLSESIKLFQSFLAKFPDSGKRPAVLWEVAWASYLSHDYPTASDYLHNLAQFREHRERALYWLGRSLIASGDQKGGEAQLATVCTDYPFGYYALLVNGGRVVADPPQPPLTLAAALPLPAGFEREKALIALGLHDEAARELSATKNRKNSLGLARLYLEMDNYNAAFHLMPQDLPRTGDAESPLMWGITFPLAFREEVAKEAANHKLPESLVYAVMRAESNYSPTALSPVGAVGLMQIMPATAEAISKGGSARLTAPELNIRLGTRHLRDLLNTFQGSIPLSVAAYNAGGGNVRRWQKSFGTLPMDEFVESITFKETREYVKKVACAMALYQRLYALPPVSPVATISH